MRRPPIPAFINVAIVLISTIAVGTLAITLGIGGILKRQRTMPHVRCLHDPNLKTYSEWRQQIKFPYEAPPSKLQQIRDNYDRVDVGASKEVVIEAFGIPDLEEELYPKEFDGSCIGYEFRYYFAKPEELTNESKDINIAVFFNPAGKVTRIVGTAGLPEKRSSSPQSR